MLINKDGIGNAVPPTAVQAIAEEILPSLMASHVGEWFMNAQGIWVINSQNDYSEVSLKEDSYAG